MADCHGNTDEKALHIFRRRVKAKFGEKVWPEQGLEARVGEGGGRGSG